MTEHRVEGLFIRTRAERSFKGDHKKHRLSLVKREAVEDITVQRSNGLDPASDGVRVDERGVGGLDGSSRTSNSKTIPHAKPNICNIAHHFLGS